MTVVRLKGSLDKEGDIAQSINDFQSDTAEIEGSPDPWLTRSTLYMATAMVVAAVLWASLAFLDKIVSARGKLTSVEANVIVQPLETSIIKTLNVKPGEMVKAGQTLATLDPTFAQSDVSQLQVRLDTLNAQIARLEAEQNDRPYAAPAGAPPEAALMQDGLWRNRQAQYRAQVQSFDERIARAKATILSSQRQREFLSAQLAQLREIEDIRKQLAASQVGSKLNVLAASANRLSLETNLTQTAAAEEDAKHNLDDLKAQREAFIRDWKNQVTQELVTKQADRDIAVEQLNKAKRRAELVSLTAPIDAVVLEVADRSINSVIREAEPLFTLVPLNAPLEVVVSISGSEIGFVREGDIVQVKFDAYNFMTHGTGEGVVKVISEDSFAVDKSQSKTDALNGLVYRARIELTKVDLRDVPENFRLMPGLPLTADIRVGERRMISYFLSPLLKGVNESMREP